MKGVVFLSYCQEDFKQVFDIRRKLEKAGYQVWMAESNLVGSEEWRREIVRSICQSDVVVACLSRNWVNRESFVYKEIRVARELEKRFPGNPRFIIPVRLEVCNIPDILEDRQWVDLHAAHGFETLFEAIQLVMTKYPKDRKSVVPEAMQHCWRLLEYLVEVGKTGFVKRCEIIATILIGLLVVEIGLLQEWAPHSQHPGGFIGWGHPRSLLAIVCSILAGAVCSSGNLWFMKRARKDSEAISRRPERFYFLSITILIFCLTTAFILLLPTTHFYPAAGNMLPRSGHFQVFKALLFIGLEIFVLLWPGWFYAVWVRRGMVYERPALLAPDSKHIAIMALVGIFGLGILQWISLKNPLEVGYGDIWRTIHIEVQGILMIALAWIAWWLRYVSERLVQKAKKLQEQN